MASEIPTENLFSILVCGFPGCTRVPSIVSTGTVQQAEQDFAVGWEFHFLACEEHFEVMKGVVAALVERLRT